MTKTMCRAFGPVALSLFLIVPQVTAAPAEGPREHAAIQADNHARREKLQALVSRDDVQAKLRSLGVAPDEAAKRVASLSDDELQRFGHRIDELPAGGDSTITIGVGAAILIAILLVVLF